MFGQVNGECRLGFFFGSQRLSRNRDSTKSLSEWIGINRLWSKHFYLMGGAAEQRNRNSQTITTRVRALMPVTFLPIDAEARTGGNELREPPRRFIGHTSVQPASSAKMGVWSGLRPTSER